MPFIISLFVRIHFPVCRPHGRADILFAADDMHAGGESQPFNRGGPVMNAYPKVLIACTRQADYQYEGILVTDISTWLCI